MPAYQPIPLEHHLAFKAIAYDQSSGQFYSPSRTRFIWDSPLVVAQCPKKDHVAGSSGCSCGFHCTWDLDIARDYINHPVSPMLLVEASGIYTVHEFGFRAQQVLVRYAVLPNQKSRTNTVQATYVAGDRFNVPVIQTEEAMLIMDLWNIQLSPDTYPVQTPGLQGLTVQKIIEIYNSIYNF